LTFAILALAAAGPAAADARAAKKSPAAQVVDTKRIDDRLLELTVRTPALASDTRVRVLLPTGYGAERRRRYPVLYLLHGASGSYADWTRAGDVARTTAGQPLIVVMPDGGRGGWYTNWYNGGRGGPPAWEDYHVSGLIPLVDRRFRTVAARRGRAIAGLSMGGFGTFSYAGRHPDLFTAAASFSGGLDLNLKLFGAPAGEITVNATASMDGGGPGAVFGDYTIENIRWRGHNPPDLAANMRGLALALHTGNGEPGGPLHPNGFDLIEFGAHEMNVNVHNRLDQLRIPHVWDDHGPGAHTFAYWARDLRETVPWLMRRFANPVPAPRRVTYTSIEPSYAVYGWRVALRRPRVEFSTLSRAGRQGFAFSGSGHATVTTPARYRPRVRYRVRILRGGSKVRRRITADRGGHLRIALPGQAGTAKVRIARAR
jgi:S-formylglutathione hydrolase FrmB